MNTAARPTSNTSSHWYYTDGRPCYELPKKDGKGMKSPTLADARKLNLVPGVSTILKVLDKPALTEWLIEQAVLAVVTAPRLEGEADDAFIQRVLHTEAQQDQEATIARDKGTDIHDAIEGLLSWRIASVNDLGDLQPWVQPAYEWIIANCGVVHAMEHILSGDGYAGRTDLISNLPNGYKLWDWKSTKSLPDPKKGGWPENKLQLAAYSKAFSRLRNLPLSPAANVYISTTEQGKFVVCEYTADELAIAYEQAFRPLVSIWQYLRNYRPTY